MSDERITDLILQRLENVEGGKMKRDIIITFVICAVLILLVMGSVFEANAAHANNKAKPKAEVSEKKISFDTGKKDAKGKAIRREFPMMFDIADRAQKYRTQRGKR